MKYPKLREITEAVVALFKGPYTSRFPHLAHKPAERFRGRPYFHEEECIACTACVQVCPTGAIEFKDETVEGKSIRNLIIKWDVCICCGQCQLHCPTQKGIILSGEFAYATCGSRQLLNQKIQKELINCDSCGKPIASYDQYLWVAQRLRALCFANASLILFYLRDLSLALKETFNQGEKNEFYRSDRFGMLCPRCRRKVVSKS